MRRARRRCSSSVPVVAVAQHPPHEPFVSFFGNPVVVGLDGLDLTTFGLLFRVPPGQTDDVALRELSRELPLSCQEGEMLPVHRELLR